MLRLLVLLTTRALLASAVDISDLHASYGQIFPTHNRNAASHLWSSWVLERAASLGHEEFVNLFAGFCPVSGSPVNPVPQNTYLYSLPRLGSSELAVGLIHHCCTPCVCDTQDLVRTDSKTITLKDGPHPFTFAVIGDPCQSPRSLARPFTDPFSGEVTTLGATAPEVRCDEASGRLRGATYSDHGAVIIGLLAPLPPSAPGSSGSFVDTRGFADECKQRASHGYNSGMGLIFREVASITTLPAHTPAAPAHTPSLPTTAASSCDTLLSAARREEIHALVQSEPVLLIGMRHMRCTNQANERLEASGVCFRTESWDDPDEPLWAYMKCLHPRELVGGMEMHSYVYIGGKYVGNGFALREASMSEAVLSGKLDAAGARMTCSRDCDSLAPEHDRTQLASMIAQPLALLGWSGCPCTNIARTRFESVGACYVQQVWPTDTAPLYKHLQCKYGKQHHSFVFVGGKFVGDGFALGADQLAQPRFTSMVSEAGARLMCQRQGDLALSGKALQSCTQSNDGSTTGWARTGSCNWDPSDSGYHEGEHFIARRPRTHSAPATRPPSDWFSVALTLRAYARRAIRAQSVSLCRRSSCRHPLDTTRTTYRVSCRPVDTG